LKFVVLGDLHLDSREAETFDRARADVRAETPQALVCLGDLGCGSHSGTRESFEDARAYLASFDTDWGTILGNHDLERVEIFATDQAAVACYCDVFGLAAPYRTIELGDALGVLLSSTGFRDNRGYKHEVSIDDAQFAWLRATLEANRKRPIFVFSHAPPLGSQLRVLQYPHLRGGNAWLNQSNAPGRFAALLAEHPQVRLWFSGHNHLAQHYEDSASLVGQCLFVHTGVIGSASRDGAHHSRIVTWDEPIGPSSGCLRIDTLDHGARRVTPSLSFDLLENELDRATDAFDEPATTFFAAPKLAALAEEFELLRLDTSAFAVHRDMLVEYDTQLNDPVGVVEDWMGRSRATTKGKNVVVKSWLGSREISPNADGYYFQVPARNPRILNELREAINRRFGR
jgi:hypothetical protein